MRFLDREDERARLMRLLKKEEGAFACLYGRRRCGKTRLLHECVDGLPNCFYFLADRSERSAQLARFVKELSYAMPAFSAADGRDWGSVLDLWMALAPRDAILVLDEFPYLVEKDDALPSILQRIVDKLRPTRRKIIICGSSQRMMQGFVLKASEPLYGRAREILPIRPLDFTWMKTAFPRMTPFERLQAWGVWGGVPRYWELQADEDDLWHAVRNYVASPLGLLRNEPQYLLMDDVDEVAQASAVLAFIGEGAHRVSEIASRMQRPVTDMSRPLQRLTELGLIVKETPFGADEKGKKSFYRIHDPFIDFWYTFIWPHWSREDFLSSGNERKSFGKSYRTHLGGVWERLVLDTLRQKAIPGVDVRWPKVGRWWGSGLNHEQMEVDVVAESSDGKTLLVGESKLKLTDIEAEHEMAELRKKASLLPFAEKYPNVICRLFVAENPTVDQIGLDWAERSRGKDGDDLCRSEQGGRYG